jgi:hypothetical protein
MRCAASSSQRLSSPSWDCVRLATRCSRSSPRTAGLRWVVVLAQGSFRKSRHPWRFAVVRRLACEAMQIQLRVLIPIPFQFPLPHYSFHLPPYSLLLPQKQSYWQNRFLPLAVLVALLLAVLWQSHWLCQNPSGGRAWQTPLGDPLRASRIPLTPSPRGSSRPTGSRTGQTATTRRNSALPPK